MVQVTMKKQRRARPGIEWFLVLGGLAIVVAISLTASLWGKRSTTTTTGPEATSDGSAAGKTSWASPRPQAIEVDDDVAGTLRLEGQVIDSDENGVAGATVVIDTRPVRSVVTEGDGSFAFTGLLGRRYLLQATAPQGVAGPTAVTLRDSTEPVILRLRGGARVDVTVVDARSGAAIAGAMVGLGGLDARTATADPQGKAGFDHVAPGPYRVTAAAPGYAPEQITATVSGTSSVSLELALRQGAAVSGRVITPAGEPAPGATVYYESVSEFAQGSSARFDAATTNASGRFQFQALPAGSFRFHARHRDFAPGSSAVVRLDGQNPRADIEIQLEPGALLRVHVRTVAGAAVAGATVRVALARDSWLPAPTRATHSDEQGDVVMRALPRARVDVAASHDAGASDVVTVDLRAPPHEQEVTLTLVRTDTIAGEVVDTAGQPVEGAQVTARPKGALELPFESGAAQLTGPGIELTDAGGRFTLHGLSPGAYQLRASRRGARYSATDALRPATSARTGDSNVRIELAADGAITGRVALASGQAPGPFTIALDGAQPAPVLSRDGSFTLGDVPPGKYAVAIRGPGFGGARVPGVVVREGQTTDVGTITVDRNPNKGRRIAGVVLADGKPARGALVLVGSSILSDGKSIKMQGSPLFGSAREAVTDEDGRFTISGLRAVSLTAIAEHESLGRSAAVPLDASPASIDDLVLELHGFGSLEGKVTRHSEPASNLQVGLQSMDANGLQLVATTGSDGTYRFDRLAPGRYKLVAMLGGLGGMSFHGLIVTVTSGAPTRADLELDDGNLSLAMTVTAENGQDCKFAWINVVSGVIGAATAAELQTIVLRGGQSYSAFAMFSDGAPAVVSGLAPGTYTACAIPFPAELSTQEEYREYHERAASQLPVFCQPVEMAETPARRDITLAATVPPFVPPPPEE